ncbi:MAG: Eco57I restriction-modification methylase domain-containing protein, partial [Anaerolineae bacterium]|nr:Eco57I restriction-modification methylase domain-containing protein [Anaerolineae bacterium]
MAEQQSSYENRAGHGNHGLFSDYYLSDLLPTLPAWTQDLALLSEAQAALDALRRLFLNIRPDQMDEAQVEEAWIKPVFQQLGHHYAVQVKIRYRDTGYRKPDYVLMPDAAAAGALTHRIYDPAELTAALAVADAKSWGARFDQASARGERNPSQQIDEYLRYSEIRWGILTDGRIWRLYERGSSKDNVYYAVDLPALLTPRGDEAPNETLSRFLYFYLFFRRQAFAPGDAGWLNRVLQESVDYAERLSDRLEDEVYEALESIAQGFLNYRRNRLTPDPATLTVIYENSLILLYRLLFILYAESRDVLPMSSNEAYRSYGSLYAVKLEARDLLEGRTQFRRREDSATLYEQLSALFLAIDSGDPNYDISPYNGRLFSDEEYPFLSRCRVGDAYLVPALKRLSFVERQTRTATREGKSRLEMVDYRDLDVRHLGAIYEKLLEYRLDIAAAPLALKNGVYVPAAAGDSVVKAAKQVYLRTGSNARKVSGSYYTPDYIVRFIVEKTLEPLLTAITARHAVLDDDGRWQVRDAEALARDLLAVNILDPATGSGHFLVEAVAWFADWMRRLNLRPADLAPDEDELIYWKRQIVTSCLYGVDLNPLAVELAKLALWLTTIARERPLSFLDHHLQVGDSLVGARLGDIARWANGAPADPAQGRLFDAAGFAGSVGGAVDAMNAIERAHILAVGDVKAQEKAYAGLRERLTPLGRLASAHTARHFGVEITAEQWGLIYAHLAEGAALPAERAGEIAALLDAADAAAAAHHFLHWELAFPEVFFDAAGHARPDGGFDAVIGNPPYVRQERIQPVKPFLAARYAVYSGTADLFLYFYERGLTLLKPEQRLGYITSGTFMNSNSAKPFRKYIHDNAAFDAFVDFGAVQPFKGADLATNAAISILKRTPQQSPFKTLLLEGRKAPLHLDLNSGFETRPETTADEEWRFQRVEAATILGRITRGYETLKEHVNGLLYRGVVTGNNDVFIIDGHTRLRLIAEDTRSAEIIKPLVRGEDLRPWYQIDSGEHLIFTRRGIDIDQYPAVKAYLERFRSRLEPKPPTWDAKHGEWQGRKAGSYRWYEIQDNVAYHVSFDSPKVLWAEIAKLPRMSLDSRGLYMNNKCYMVGSGSHSLLAVLQSRLTWFCISQIATPLAMRGGLWRYQLFEQFVERLPIPPLTADQESSLAALAEEITSIARARYGLHEAFRHRLRADLGEGAKLNTA